MKNVKSAIIFSLFVGLLFGSCSNVFNSQKDKGTSEGFGRVSISFAVGQARTVFPDREIFNKYEYFFTQEGEAPIEKNPGPEGYFFLETGNWTVSVNAYVGVDLAAAGSAAFTVGSPGSALQNVEVILTGVDNIGTGTLTMEISYPFGFTPDISLKKLPFMTERNISGAKTNDGTTEVYKITEIVDAGFYLLSISMSKGGWNTGVNEAVHIYNGMETKYEKDFSFADNDFVETTINMAAIKDIKPVIGGMQITRIDTAQYTGEIVWEKTGNIGLSAGEKFASGVVYTAEITLTPEAGYTLQGVGANFFKVEGA